MYRKPKNLLIVLMVIISLVFVGNCGGGGGGGVAPPDPAATEGETTTTTANTETVAPKPTKENINAPVLSRVTKSSNVQEISLTRIEGDRVLTFSFNLATPCNEIFSAVPNNFNLSILRMDELGSDNAVIGCRVIVRQKNPKPQGIEVGSAITVRLNSPYGSSKRSASSTSFASFHRVNSTKGDTIKKYTYKE